MKTSSATSEPAEPLDIYAAYRVEYKRLMLRISIALSKSVRFSGR